MDKEAEKTWTWTTRHETENTCIWTNRSRRPLDLDHEEALRPGPQGRGVTFTWTTRRPLDLDREVEEALGPGPRD